MKALVVTDERGRPLSCGEVRAGSVADINHARDAGLLADTIDLQILADVGCQGLAAQTCGQVIPHHANDAANIPRTPARTDGTTRTPAMADGTTRGRTLRPLLSQNPVGHGIAHLKNWRARARHHTRRENLLDTIRTVAGLLTDQQATHHTQALDLPTTPA
ncbi:MULTISPECIES: transposase [unclassified Streptomyces]|uniref:transposase n=1 Tax=unclassified Streptomyces TaxID=2593676 RepID=UPI000AFAE125|nr:transposase [Streptomyces sp. TSRI0281]